MCHQLPSQTGGAIPKIRLFLCGGLPVIHLDVRLLMTFEFVIGDV